MCTSQLPVGDVLESPHVAVAIPLASVLTVAVHCTLPSGRRTDKVAFAPPTLWLLLSVTLTRIATVVLPVKLSVGVNLLPFMFPVTLEVATSVACVGAG